MVEPARLRFADLVNEAIAGMLQRPGRSVLTMAGTILGMGAFVAIIGLTASASGQIDNRFTELAATEVTVADAGQADGLHAQLSFPLDAREKAKQIHGVVDGGLYWPLPLRNPTVTGAPDLPSSGSGLGLYAADQGVLAAMHVTLSSGRTFDGFHERTRQHVALLGAAAATRLGIRELDSHPAVFVDGIPFTVMGIIADTRRLPDLLLAVIIPAPTALEIFGPPDATTARMLVETVVGGAKVVADQLPVALRPDAPLSLTALAPADPQRLRGGVSDDLNALLLVLAAVSLVIGTFGIANTTLVAVLERTQEIGLRRSVGASARHVAVQFLAESGVLGGLGGLIGGSLGVMMVVGVAISRSWTPLLNPWVVVAAPLAGALVGVAAGAYPAWRAARIDPVDALRR